MRNNATAKSFCDHVEAERSHTQVSAAKIEKFTTIKILMIENFAILIDCWPKSVQLWK